jgi:hypothetical protein
MLAKMTFHTMIALDLLDTCRHIFNVVAALQHRSCFNGGTATPEPRRAEARVFFARAVMPTHAETLQKYRPCTWLTRLVVSAVLL